MAESMYVDRYLARNAARMAEGAGPITPGSYLNGVLRGKAKSYGGRYLRALEAALAVRLADGRAVTMRSVGGMTAVVYAPTADQAGDTR